MGELSEVEFEDAGGGLDRFLKNEEKTPPEDWDCD